MKKRKVWLLLGIAVVVAVGLTALANDGGMVIEEKDCGCPSGWVRISGGTECLNLRTEEVIPYCRETPVNT